MKTFENIGVESGSYRSNEENNLNSPDEDRGELEDGVDIVIDRASQMSDT